MNAKVGVRRAPPGARGDAPPARETTPPPFVERLNTIGNAPPKPRKLVKLTYTLPAHGLAAAGFRSISIHSLSTKIPAKPKGWLGTAKPTAPRSTMAVPAYVKCGGEPAAVVVLAVAAVPGGEVALAR